MKMLKGNFRNNVKCNVDVQYRELHSSKIKGILSLSGSHPLYTFNQLVGDIIINRTYIFKIYYTRYFELSR